MVKFVRDGDGVMAFAPGLLGCHTWAPTLEEAKRKMEEALEAYLETLQEHNIPIPFGRWVRTSPPPTRKIPPRKSRSNQDWKEVALVA
jgi:predicted RNase H-like HicB family nuclease